MRGFMQAAGLVEVKPVEVKSRKPKQATPVKRMTDRERAVAKLADALPLLQLEFTTKELAILTSNSVFTTAHHMTRLRDLGAIDYVGKRGYEPTFKLIKPIAEIVALLLSEGFKSPKVTKAERLKQREAGVRVQMIAHLKLVPEVFTSIQLREATKSRPSVAVIRINIMLRQGLVEPFESEKWSARKPRTYKKVIQNENNSN